MKKKNHQVFPHFSVEVLKQKYLECEHHRERTHWHIIWLLADTTHTRTPRQVAEIIGCTPDRVRKLIKRYNAESEAAIRGKRKDKKGRRFWMNHSKLPFLRLLLMAVFGEVRR